MATTMKPLLNDFKSALRTLEANNKDAGALKKGAATLTKIKIAMLEFDATTTMETDMKAAKEQLLLSREALELATLYSATIRDIDSFKRHIAQVQLYYRDYSDVILESARKWMILGLNLMHLLAESKLSEFHTELELIPLEARKDIYISYPIEVEQRLMEGSYSKVRKAREKIPSDYYIYFMDTLVDTVRERISECSMKAYKSVPFKEAKTLLLLDTDEKIKAYAQKRGWSIESGEIHWNQKVESKLELKSKDLIEESLGFATELERIV